MPNFRGFIQGDSGGPMVVRESDGVRTLVGVTSYLIYGEAKTCRNARVNVFAFTGRQLDWISRNTGIRILP